jgi:hypothetical protein
MLVFITEAGSVTLIVVNDQQQRCLSAGCLRDKRPLCVNGAVFLPGYYDAGLAITRGFWSGLFDD